MNELQAMLKQIIDEKQIKEIRDNLSNLEMKSEDEGQKTFKVVASTEDTDRSWEIVKVDGWDTENFMKNPVIIANHIYKIENIVGKATKIYVKDKKLIVEGVFSKTNPLAKILSDLYDEWMVKTVSVGFVPIQRQEDNRKVIVKQELLELSFVAVPCNPEALSLDQKELYKKGLEAGILKEEDQEEQNENPELEKKIDELTNIVLDLKADVKALVDGNTKQNEEANFLAKETLQSVARTVNEWLANYKKSLLKG